GTGGSCAYGFYSILCDVGQQAAQARINGFTAVSGVGAAADGNVYFSMGPGVYRVSPGGQLSHVGGRIYPPAGNADGGLAVDMSFNATSGGVESLHVGPDGSIYVIVDGRVVRRIGTDGRVQTVVGLFGPTPQGFNGDG